MVLEGMDPVGLVLEAWKIEGMVLSLSLSSFHLEIICDILLEIICDFS